MLDGHVAIAHYNFTTYVCCVSRADTFIPSLSLEVSAVITEVTYDPKHIKLQDLENGTGARLGT